MRKVQQSIVEHEGFKSTPYPDPLHGWKDSDNVFHANHPLVDVVDAYRAIGARRAQLIATEGQYADQIISGTLTDPGDVTWTRH